MDLMLNIGSDGMFPCVGTLCTVTLRMLSMHRACTLSVTMLVVRVMPSKKWLYDQYVILLDGSGA